MSRPVDVIWVIEHVARELDVACAVKALVEQRYGLTVEILSIQANVRVVTRQWQPRLVVTPFLYGAHLAAISHFIAFWHDPIYFNLAWEQLFSKSTEKYKAIVGDFTKHHVIHHAWGDFFRQNLIAQGVDENLIVLNGQPAYKLYDEPYRQYFPSRAALAKRHGLNPDRRWIVFPENYSWAFYTDAGLEQLIAYGANRELTYQLRDFTQNSFAAVLHWCKTAATNHDVEIILRPRPAHAAALMDWKIRETIGERPANFHVIKDGSVREWILASDAVVSSYSTTLIEAAVARKGAYMLEPYPFLESQHSDWHQYAARITTYEAFDTLARCGPVWSDTERLHDWARQTMLAHGDPIQNIAALIGTFTRPDFNRPPIVPPDLFPSQDRTPPAWRPVASRMYRKARRAWLKRIDPSKSYDQFESDDFTHAEVQRRTAAWARVLNH
ncbi:MAG: hypothetical protein IT324_08010 [Anaerolineae bacterium]|nr:hypothetical protein [Anaerolineae bacterium]